MYRQLINLITIKNYFLANKLIILKSKKLLLYILYKLLF